MVVKRGSSSVSVARVTTVANDEPVPSALNTVSPVFRAPTRSERPTMPFTLIITAAKTVSRASSDVSLWPLTMRVTIRATSMTVTATARISEPYGSPTRWATTSAWCTAASTAPTRTTKTTAAHTGAG